MKTSLHKNSILAVTIALILIFCLFLASCGAKDAPAETSTSLPPTQSATPELPAQSEPSAQSAAPAQSESPADTSGEQGLTVNAETYTDAAAGAMSIQYYTVSGMADTAVQDLLNENIEAFYLWQWLYGSGDADGPAYEGYATYTIIGEKYLCVQRMLVESPVSYESPKRISNDIFDLSTGEQANNLVSGGAAYLLGNTSEAFTLAYAPDADTAAAENTFHDEMMEEDVYHNMFLGEDSLTIYIPNDAETDYYEFTAKYEDILAMLSPDMTEAIQGE